MVDSIWWILCLTVFLATMENWVHRCPQPSWHILKHLVNFIGYCYQLDVRFALLVGRKCDVISFRDQTSLHHGCCVVSSLPPFVVWGSLNHSPWYAHSFHFREDASCCGRRDQPWAYLLLVFVCYEQQINSHIDCSKSLNIFSAPIRVTGCWISSLGYTR